MGFSLKENSRQRRPKVQSESVRDIDRVLASKMPLEQSFRNLEDAGYTVKALNGSHQIRIGSRLDIFPKSIRWHDVKENKRGQLSETPLDVFVKRYLGPCS